MIDIVTGVIPLVLVVAFLLLMFRSMDGRGSMVDRMKQSVGGTVMLLVGLLVVFAFIGGGGDDPTPGPDPPEPVETYAVSFFVATDSIGYGTVSNSSLQAVPEGTAVTIAQTLSFGGAGQCAAVPTASTSEYTYAFSHWTGADDADTPAATTITADTAYYAHFTRTEVPPETVLYDVSFYVATDSIGYGTVGIQGLSDVPEGTAVTVAQTISVGGMGQCAATPAADTAQYAYAFDGWTGADDASTQAPTSVNQEVHYYAHFTRTERTYTAYFHVATDSQGYGTVSVQSVQGVPYGTSVTIGQTIAVGAVGQCAAVPATNTSQYEYSFSGWTGADDSSTQAPTTITEDVHFYAHFTRTEVGPTPMDPSNFTFTVSAGSATLTGWATGKKPTGSYDLWIPETDGAGHPVTTIDPGIPSGSGATSPFTNAKSLRADSVTKVAYRAFIRVSSLQTVDLPSVRTIQTDAFNYCTGIQHVSFGPLSEINAYAVSAWTFYDTNGTTVLQKTAANLANSTFEGTASALVKVAAGAKTLSPEMQQRAAELAAENVLKASMLADLDPELADMDSTDVARMTINEIRGLTSEDVQALKQAVRDAKAARGE